MASAAEAETAGIFFNAQTAVPIRRILVALGHPQPATPVKTDNSTATQFTKSSMKQKWSKAWDMRFHWLRDKQAQRHFHVYWDKGENNMADYFTKHHSPEHHKRMRPKYVHALRKVLNCLRSLSRPAHVRGCVNDYSDPGVGRTTGTVNENDATGHTGGIGVIPGSQRFHVTGLGD